MKILFVNFYENSAISGGGAEVTLHHLMRALREFGVEPILLTTTHTPGLSCEVVDGVKIWRAGLRNIYWPMSNKKYNIIYRTLWHIIDSYNLAMQPFLKKVLAAENPDVVSLHNLPGWSAAVWETISEKEIPTIQVLHDMYSICPRSTMFDGIDNCKKQCEGCALLRLPHRSASMKVSAVVGVSKFILDRHIDYGYFHGVPIKEVIHNARDAKTLGVGAALGKAKSSSSIRIGYIGRLEKSKGIEWLLKSFISANISGAKLLVAGKGSENYENALVSEWSSDRIRFLGKVKPKDFYPDIDIIVVPSLWNEPLGMVVAEALAFGKPVIASRVGGIPEMITHDFNGLLVDPNSQDSLVGALVRISDSNFRSRMEVGVNMSALPYLDVKGWADKYLSIYKKISTL